VNLNVGKRMKDESSLFRFDSSDMNSLMYLDYPLMDHTTRSAYAARRATAFENAGKLGLASFWFWDA